VTLTREQAVRTLLVALDALTDADVATLARAAARLAAGTLERRGPLCPLDGKLAQLLELRAEGRSYEQIARAFGVTKQAVFRRVQRAQGAT